MLATKVFGKMGEGPNDRGLSRKHVIEQANASLKRLGVDYVDIYYSHRFDADTPLEETLRAFDDLVRQGKVLYIGADTSEKVSHCYNWHLRSMLRCFISQFSTASRAKTSSHPLSRHCLKIQRLPRQETRSRAMHLV